MGGASLRRGSSRAALLGIAALCLALRLALFLAVRPWDETVAREVIVRSDAAGYHLLAANLLAQHRFSAVPGQPETLRTPLYPAFVAAHYAAFGSQPWIVLLAQIGLAVISCGLLFRAVERMLGRLVACCSALFFALDPFLVFFSVTLMSETLFVFLCVLASCALARAIERRFEAGTGAHVAAAGLALGLAALVRPIAVYLPGAIALFLAASLRGAPRRALRHTAVFTAVFAATLAPWAARNLASCGAFAVSSSGAYNLLVVNVVPLEMERTGAPFEVVKPALLAEADAQMRADGLSPAEANGFEKAPYQSRLALHYIAERPLGFLKFYALGVFTSFANLGTRGFADLLGLRDVHDDRFDLRAHPNLFEMLRAALAHKTAGELWIAAVNGGSLLLFYACLAAGLLAARGMPAGAGRCFLLLCGVLAAYYIALTGAAGLARFRVAAMPYLVVLAGVGAAHLYARARAGWRWPQGAARTPSWSTTAS